VYYVDTFEILIQSLNFAISSICSQILTNTRVIHFLRKPYLDSKTPTMKLYIAAAALPALVSSYSMGSGGFRYYGCPDIFVSPGRAQEEGFSCDPRGSWQAAQQQQQKEWVDRAFEQLESEFNNNGTPNRQRRAQRSEEFVNSSDDGKYLDLRQQQQQEYLQKQQEWVNRAFGLATEVASEIATSSSSGRDFKEAKNEAVRQQQEWLNRAFGLATEVASDMLLLLLLLLDEVSRKKKPKTRRRFKSSTKMYSTETMRMTRLVVSSSSSSSKSIYKSNKSG
jgi:hypothetical protein